VARTARGSRAIGALRWVERHADDLKAIQPQLPDGLRPDFLTRIDGQDWLTSLKNYPGFNDMPKFLKSKLVKGDAPQHLRYAEHGPAKLVYSTPMPLDYIDDPVRQGVPRENIINGF
jgi:hypothetical protein